jgi:hypothetical protein
MFLDKVCLDIVSLYQAALPVLKDIWHCLDELKCDGKHLGHINKICNKNFDKLHVTYIENSGKYRVITVTNNRCFRTIM